MLPSRIAAAWAGAPACRSCGIRHLALFADLEEADFRHIHMPIEEMELAESGPLYGLDDPAAAVFTVRAGIVKLTQIQSDGGQRIVRLVRAGGVAGLEALVRPSYAQAATALTPVAACRIPIEVVRGLQTATPRLHGRLMEKWHEALSAADAFLVDLSTGGARRRLARLLLMLADEVPDGAPAPLFVREDLGSLLAVTLETASRAVSDLERSGAIVKLGPHRARLDRARLEAIAAEG